MMKKLCLILSGFILCSHMFGQTDKEFAFLSKKKSNTQATFSFVKTEKNDTLVFTLSSKDTQKHLSQKSIAIDVGSGVIDITLRPIEVLGDNFTVIVDNKIISHPAPPLFYIGSVADNPDAVVCVMSTGEDLHISIYTEQACLRIHPDTKRGGKRYVGYQEGFREHARCEAMESPLAMRTQKSTVQKSGQTETLNCLEVSVHTDYATYQSFGSDTNAMLAYVYGLFHEVAVFYEISTHDTLADNAISVKVSEVQITADSMLNYSASASNAIELLDTFGIQVQNAYQGRAAMLITTRPLDGGRAWINALCSSFVMYQDDWDNNGILEDHSFGPYSVATSMGAFENYPVYSYDVAIVAHELGHTLGSPHTHACAWGPNSNQALDDCFQSEGGCGVVSNPTPGTIMSYCHTNESVGIDFTKGFGPEPKALVRDKFFNAPCYSQLCLCPQDSLLVHVTDTSVFVEHGMTHSDIYTYQFFFDGNLVHEDITTEGMSVTRYCPVDYVQVSDVRGCMWYDSVSSPMRAIENIIYSTACDSDSTYVLHIYIEESGNTTTPKQVEVQIGSCVMYGTSPQMVFGGFVRDGGIHNLVVRYRFADCMFTENISAYVAPDTTCLVEIFKEDFNSDCGFAGWASSTMPNPGTGLSNGSFVWTTNEIGSKDVGFVTIDSSCFAKIDDYHMHQSGHQGTAVLQSPAIDMSMCEGAVLCFEKIQKTLSTEDSGEFLVEFKNGDTATWQTIYRDTTPVSGIVVEEIKIQLPDSVLSPQCYIRFVCTDYVHSSDFPAYWTGVITGIDNVFVMGDLHDSYFACGQDTLHIQTTAMLNSGMDTISAKQLVEISGDAILFNKLAIRSPEITMESFQTATGAELEMITNACNN